MEPDEEMVASARVHGKGRVQIPAKIRKKLGIADGSLVVFTEDARGRFIIRAAPKRTSY